MSDKTVFSRDTDTPPSRCGLQNCPHIFQFKQRKFYVHPFPETVIEFCPVFNEKKGYHQNIFPEGNFNNAPYMETFMLECDKSWIVQQKDTVKQMHCDKIKKLMMPGREIMVAHPGKNKEYCHVCKVSYDDYQTHINLKSHKNKIRSNQFEADISQLAKQYEQNNINQKLEFKPWRTDSLDTDADFTSYFERPAQKEAAKDILELKETKKQVNRRKIQQKTIQQMAFQDSEDEKEVEEEVNRIIACNYASKEEYRQVEIQNTSDFLQKDQAPVCINNSISNY